LLGSPDATWLVGAGATASQPVATTSRARHVPAIVASAADPNALEARRTSIVDALASQRAMHVVLEQGACYPGIPSRYGDGYILAVWDAEEVPVRADLASAGVDAEWSGRATVTCLD
jgi:hypothetical protein